LHAYEVTGDQKIRRSKDQKTTQNGFLPGIAVLESGNLFATWISETLRTMPTAQDFGGGDDGSNRAASS